MKESPLMIKSKAFALDVIRVCRELRTAKCESALITFPQKARSSRLYAYNHTYSDFVTLPAF